MVGCRPTRSPSSREFHLWKDESVQKWWAARRILHAAARGYTRDTDALSRSTICRGYFTAVWYVILKFSYPSFGMDPTTPPDVGRHGYLSFRGCMSVCWSPVRARTKRRRSPSPTRGRWCNPRCPLCTCLPLSSRYPVHRLRDKLNLHEKICFLTWRCI